MYQALPRNELFAQAVQSELGLRKKHPLVWWSTLLGPVVLTAIVLAALYVICGHGYVHRLLATAAATMFLAGRFVILAGSTEKFFGPWELSCLVFYMDMMVALPVIYHTGFLFRLPWLGGRLALVAVQSRDALAQHRWIRRITFLATVAFVMFPLASTGSVGGGILARICGMSRAAALAAITLGSGLGCGAMFVGASLIRRYLTPDSPATIIGGIALIVAIIVLLNLLYRWAVRSAASGAPETPGAIDTTGRITPSATSKDKSE